MRPMQYTLTVLAVAGCWQPATSLFKYIMYNAYAMLIILMLYTFSISQFMDLVLNVSNSDEFTETLYLLLIVLMACYKAIDMNLSHKNVAIIIKYLTESPFAPLDKNEKIIREKFDKIVE